MGLDTRSNRNPTYLILAGVVVSVLGALLVIVLLSRPVAVLPQQQTDVIVANHDIAVRAKISDSDVSIAHYPTGQIPAHAFTSVDQVRDKFAAVTISNNSPITDSMLATSASAAAPSSLLDIPAGQVAIAIPSGDTLANVSGYIQSGDKIDILARGLPGETSGAVEATFTDLTIVLAGGPSGARGHQPAAGTWVVFVPIVQAEQLVYLFSNGQYTFVLKSTKDSNPTGTVAPVDKAQFNSAFGVH
jgi:Flp pilus assembly protein CpaB